LLIAVTGWGQEEDKRRARAEAFDRHLTKPIDPTSLENLIRDTNSISGRGTGPESSHATTSVIEPRRRAFPMLVYAPMDRCHSPASILRLGDEP